MSFIAKLKLKPGEPLFLINTPLHLGEAFLDADVKTRLPKTATAKQVLFFAEDSTRLEAVVPSIFESLQKDGLLWIAYPKKSGSIPSDLHRDAGWDVMFRSEWEGVASISIDSDWTGMRFRHNSTLKNAKRVVPMEERVVEGIDFINRKVKLPADASAAMASFPGLEAFFYSQSFTCQKEHVEAIVEAKKPETRQRRIDKTIEMVLKLRDEKELKALKKKK